MPSYASSMENLAKGRAGWRRPRPGRSSDESRMIQRFGGCSGGRMPQRLANPVAQITRGRGGRADEPVDRVRLAQ